MPRNDQDPAGSTQQFQAFTSRREAAGGGSSAGTIIGVAVGVLVVAAVLVAVFAA